MTTGSQQAQREPISGHLRVAEILVPLSLVTDLGMGLPDERAMHACLLATALAREHGLGEPDVSHVYYTTLLEHLGCTATAAEEARHVGGDHLAMRQLVSHTDEARPAEMLTLLTQIGRDQSLVPRARAVVGMIGGFRWGPPVQAAVCEVAARLASRLGLASTVQEALGQVFERWDGKGAPLGLRADSIALAARFAQLASRAIGLHHLAGPDAAVQGVKDSSGGWLDPEIAVTFARCGRALLTDIDAVDALPATMDAEPEPRLTVPRERVDEMARAFGDMVDLLSPFTLGHSNGVSAIAEAAGDALGLSMRECVTLRRAALLHDLGRVGVPAGIWAKRGALTMVDWERVRLHPYFTERILAHSTVLTEEAAIAGMHHERLDGRGYHRGSSGREQPLPARILAAADAYQAMRQDRAHRAALPDEQAADELARMAQAGALDSHVVEAVLGVMGEHRQIRHDPLPAGLSEREAEVLQLLAGGCSNPEIARRLVISRRTAEHHVQNAYAKIGVSTRAGATLFALEHGLLAHRA